MRRNFSLSRCQRLLLRAAKPLALAPHPGPLESALSPLPLSWEAPPEGRERQCLLTHLCVSCDLEKAQIFGVMQLYSHTCLERVGAWPGHGSGSHRARQAVSGAKSAVGKEKILPSWVGWTQGWESGQEQGKQGHSSFPDCLNSTAAAPAPSADGNSGTSTWGGSLSQWSFYGKVIHAHICK